MKHRKYYSMLMFLTFFAGMLSLTGCEEYESAGGYDEYESTGGYSNRTSELSCVYCQGKQICAYCLGRGHDPYGNYCLECRASGKCIKCCQIGPNEGVIPCGQCCMGTCVVCAGLKHINGYPCHRCGGTGRCLVCNGSGLVRP